MYVLYFIVHTKCSTNNGGCDAFCMPSGTTSRTCYCDGGIGLTYNNFYTSECKGNQRSESKTNISNHVEIKISEQSKNWQLKFK